MSKNKKSDRKNDYQHFKATIGAISEEVDYFGNHKEVLSLNKVHLNTKKIIQLPIMPLSIKTKLQRLYLSWHIKVQQIR